MDPELDQHPGSSLVFFAGSQGLREPFFFPSYLPSQGSLLLASQWCVQSFEHSWQFHFWGPCSSLPSCVLPYGLSVFSPSHQHKKLSIEHRGWNTQLPSHPTHALCFLHFCEGSPKGVSGTESRLNAQWPACSADLLTEALYVWQEHSGLWSATPMGSASS